MSVLEWFFGLLLITLSLFVLVAALTKREGVLRIGKITVTEGEGKPQTRLESIRLSDVALAIIGFLAGLAMILVFAV